jgi:hypothetical protein
MPFKNRALAATFLTLAGCSSNAMLLESDVPLPNGMETVRSADIRRSAGTVSGGSFVLAGPCNDAADLLASTVERYRSNGWVVVAQNPGLDRSVAEFSKDTRRLELAIQRRALEPDMSSGFITITSTASTAALPPTAAEVASSEASTRN